MKRHALLLGALLCGAGGAAAQSSAEVCAGIAAPADRLACYDRMTTPTDARPPEPAPPAPAAPTPVTPDAERFGLPRAAHEKPPEQISARLVGSLTSWRRGTRFRLDNGQVWEAVEKEDGHYTSIPENPEVVIYRSIWGAFWLEVPVVDLKIKVRRIS